MTSRTRPAKVVLAVILGAPAALCLLILAGLAFLQSAPGERWLAGRIEVALGTPEAPVRVASIEVTWPLDLRASEIGIADSQGEWITVDDLALDWSPSRLIGGTFAAESITAGRIHVARQPIAAPPGTASESSPGSGDVLPRLPVAVDIRHMAAELSVAEAVTGNQGRLRLDGRAALAGERADVVLNVQRTDSQAGQGQVLIDFDQATGRLGLDVDISEPVGAILTQLVSGAQLPPMALRIAGEGRLSDWRGTVLASTGGRPCIDAILWLSGDGALDMRIEGEALPECLPPQIGQALGATPDTPAAAPDRRGLIDANVRLASLAAEAQESPDAEQPAKRPSLGEGAVRFRGGATLDEGEVRLGDIEVETPLGAFSFSGTITGESLSGQFALGSADVARLAAQAGVEVTGQAMVTGTLAGTRAAPIIQARLESADGSAYGVAWTQLRASVDLRRSAEGGAWLTEISGGAEAIAGLPQPLAGPVKLAMSAAVDQEQRLVQLATARLSGGGASLSLFGVIRDWGGNAALHGFLSSPRLADLKELTGLDLNGSAGVRFSARGDLITPALRVGFSGSARGFGMGIGQVDALFGTTPRLSGDLDLTTAGPPFVKARIDGAAATLGIAGTAGNALSLGWRLTVPDLAALEQDLTGSAAATGYVLGRPADPRLGAVVRADGTVPGLARPVDLLAAVSARDLFAEPQGLVAADLRSSDVQVAMRTAYRLGEQIALTDLSLASGDDRIAGDLVIRGDGLLRGTLKGELADIERWSALAGQPLGGRLAFDATLAPDAGQSLRADLRGSDLRIGDNRVGAVRGDIRLSDILSAPTGTASLTGERLTVAGLDLARASLDAEGDGQAVAFALDASGGGLRRLLLDTRGSWAPQADGHRVLIASLRAVSGDITARLVDPTNVTLTSAGDVALAPTLLDVDGGRVALRGTVQRGVIDARLELGRLPLKLVAPLLIDEPAQGVLDGDLSMTGTTERPQAVARLSGRGIGFGAAVPERIDLDANARWSNGVVRLEADARGGAGSTATMTASFPLVTLGLVVPPDGTMSAAIVANGDLERITELLPLAGHRFAGRLQADVQVAGTVAQPVVGGRANLSRGYYQFFETGTVIRDIEARLVAEDSRTFDLRMNGTDGRGGRMDASGTVRTDPGGLAYTANMDFRDLRVIEVDAGTAQANGALVLSGRGDAATLIGRLDLGPAEYDITGNLPGGAVPTMEVIEINKPGQPRPRVRPGRDQRAAARAPAETPLTVALDIQTRVERLFVRGRGLDSEWGGALAVAGTLSQPRVIGNLQVVRGNYEFIGRRFELAESRVVFDGGAEIDPRLDVVAEAQAGDMTAQVRVSGGIDAPQFNFTSNPPYPEDEIMSRLLFGRQIGQLSVVQQIQIARAAASLAGGDGGFDPVGELRRGLGLDMLELGADEERGGLSPTVTVGRYLDDDTFLRVEEGGRDGGEVAIERQLGRGLSVEGEVGRRGGGGVGLTWRRDY